MTTLLRRIPSRDFLTLSLLGVAVLCLVNGLGTTVRGAAISAFLPAGLLAALLGWGLGNRRYNGWLAAVGLVALGGILLWVATARLDGPLFRLAVSTFSYLVETIASWRAGPPPDPAAMHASLEAIATQSAALWGRVVLWVTTVSLNVTIDDVVVRVMVWSLAVWLVCAWAGWALRRVDALTALTPALVVLAFITDYTELEIQSLWLMLVILLALTGLGRYHANLERWATRSLDYAELITANTLVSLAFLTAMLAVLAWVLPVVPVREIIENMRRRPNQSTAPQSLGLQEAPAEGPGSTYGRAALPRQHLISAGPNLSQDVVFTVRTGEISAIPFSSAEVNAPNHHWRSQTFDRYTGYGWFSSDTVRREIPAGDALFTTLPPGYRLLEQEFTIVHSGDRLIYWTGALYRIDQRVEVSWRVPPALDPAGTGLPFNESDLFGAVREAASYRAEAYVPIPNVEQLRAAGQQYPDSIRSRYLGLPDRVPERVYALARELTATSATPFDQAVAIETYLRKNFEYTLDLPAPPVDVEIADYFLFELKRGYCDYYATSMAVLARAVGLPARVVTGYASGNYDSRTAEYIVREADAHSWAEIYFPGIGWIEFEPTSNQPGFNRPLSASSSLPPAELPLPSLLETVRQSFNLLSPLARLAVSIPAGAVALFILLLALEDILLKVIPPALSLRWMFRNLYRFGGRLEQPTPATTATEFSAALLPYTGDKTSLLELTALYLQALFSAHPVQAQLVRRNIKAWRALRWRLVFSKSMKS
jgi:transglutaminase-like putative cysteine protease